MFQFSPLAPRFLWIQKRVTRHDSRRVSPFGHLRINAYVRPDKVARMLAAHMDRRADHEHPFWALLTLELWLRNLSKLSRPWEAAPEPVPIVAKAG